MKKSLIFSIVILISFFLPWMKFFFGSMSGYDLTMLVSARGNDGEYFFVLLAYLIPICALLVIDQELGITKISINPLLIKVLKIIPFIIAVIILIRIIVLVEDEIFKALAFGFYFEFIFSLLLFINSLSPGGSTETANPFSNITKTFQSTASKTSVSFCPECGAKTTEGAVFCSECGKSLK